MENFGKLYSEANENIVPSPDFTKRTMDRIFSEEKVTRFPARKTLILIAAAILLLALGACTAAVVVQYIANRTPLSFNQYYSSASDNYASPVNLYAESGGLELVLTEAVFENDTLIMTFDYEVEGYDYVSALLFSGELRIDGRCTHAQSSGIGYIGDDKTWYVMEFDLAYFNLTDIHEFELIVSDIDVQPYSEKPDLIAYSGLWSYSFFLDTSALAADTVIYQIDRYVTLYNGDEIYLDKIICNPMTQRLLYYTPLDNGYGFLPLYDVYAESKDGRCDFRADSNVMGRAKSLNFKPDQFDITAESLTLKITVTGEEGVLLCDPFEITCSKETD